MIKGKRIAVLIPCFNEAEKLRMTLLRLREVDGIDETILIHDGSKDSTAGFHVTSLSHEKRQGVGAALRTGLAFASSKFDVIVIMAGNNKDEPQEIPLLIEKLVSEKALLVIGSRYMKGGMAGGEMPLYRKWATRLHPFLFSMTLGVKLTESTNGFRAIDTKLLFHPKINLNQSWLDGYALEPYLLYQTIRLGMKWAEVPVTKTYPPKKLGYTKMAPITGWWEILKPIFLLRFGFRS